jgi:serine/threonine protein kinase
VSPTDDETSDREQLVSIMTAEESRRDRAAGRRSPVSLAVGARLGAFEILSRLGGGGMGEVHRARDTRLDRTVAIKILPEHLGQHPDLRQRFEREARVVSSLNHSHICALYDIGHQDGTDYLVLEYIEGESLHDRLGKGPLPLEQALRYGSEIADALGRAHRSGIIHRDLKPANVLMDNEGHACLSDFGLVRQFSTNDAVYDGPETFCEGTAPYMSPAVARGEIEDTRCDIYGFGAMLYELLTGHLPYTYNGAQTMRRTLTEILEGPPPRIHVRNPKAPAGLVAIAEGCMARELRDRYAKMSDVVTDLERVAAGKAPLGPHHTWSMPRWLKIVISISFCLALLVAAWTWVPPLLHRPKPVDLMPLIKFDGPALVGTITPIAGDGFDMGSDPSAERAVLSIPYEPQGAYDLVITFTRLSGDNGLDHCLIYNGHRFAWTLAGFGNSTSGFWKVGGSFLGGTNPTSVRHDNWLEDNRKYTSEVRVRGKSISAYLDGQHLVTHPTDYSDISGDDIIDPLDKHLALSALQSTFRIHSIRLVPRSPSDPP